MNDDDYQPPCTIHEAFDFNFSEVLSSEKEAIQKARRARRLGIREKWHGGKRALERDIKLRDIYHCVEHGKAEVKDPIPWNPEVKGVKQAGINYDGHTLNGTKKIRVKVGWTQRGYTIITVHER